MEMESSKINRDSFVPPFYQLAAILEQKIYAGEFKLGDSLPSETVLGKNYELSRMTVRKCLNILAERGLIIARQGRGTFVSRPCLDRATFVMDEFAEEMARQRLEPGYRLVDARFVNADASIAGKLQVPPATRILYYCRLLLGNNQPWAVEHKYLRYVKGRPVLENELQYTAFSEIIALLTDILPVRSRMTLSVEVAAEKESGLLELTAGFPVAKVEQTLFAEDGSTVGLGVFYYRGDRYRLVSDMQPLRGEEAKIPDCYPLKKVKRH